MSTKWARRVQITGNDHGPIIDIVAWMLMVAMILAVIFRLLVRTLLTHSPGAEDCLIVGSLLLGVGQVIALSLGVKNGLGRRMMSLSETEALNMQKAVYASDILYVATLSLAKLSVLYLLRRLTNKSPHRYYISVVSGIIACWTVAAILSIACQCGRGHPWDYETKNCISMLTFWDAIGAFDILSEVLIMIQPLGLVWDLHMSRWNKTVIAGAFLFRIIVIITIILRLVYLRVAFRASDRSFQSVGSSICTQAEICMSIVTACIPVTKPFLDGFASGMLGSSLNHRIPRMAQVESYSMQNLGSGPRAHRKKQFDTAKSIGQESDSIMATTATATAQATGENRRDMAGTPSISSTRSDQMMIKRTDQWYVQYEDNVQFSSDIPQASSEGPS